VVPKRRNEEESLATPFGEKNHQKNESVSPLGDFHPKIK
jgi:hypothetical protein